jgi:hypothetical protein
MKVTPAYYNVSVGFLFQVKPQITISSAEKDEWHKASTARYLIYNKIKAVVIRDKSNRK